MLKASLCALALIVSTPLLHAQKVYTATRKANIQVGLEGSSYSLDYGEGREKGLTIFGDVDITHHIGAEVLYRNASIVTPGDVGENHVLAGPRFYLTRNRFTPYLKGLLASAPSISSRVPSPSPSPSITSSTRSAAALTSAPPVTSTSAPSTMNISSGPPSNRTGSTRPASPPVSRTTSSSAP